MFLARWQEETIFALIIVRTAGQTGSRISNARSDRKLFLSVIFKIFPHSPIKNDMNQFGGGGFVNLYLEMYVSNIKTFLLRILRNRRGTELFLRIDDAQVFKQ